MLEEKFIPTDVEKLLYEKWENGGYFAPSKQGNPFSIVLPPPNVTGNLHIGHALNNVMQDIIVRYQRLCGKSTLWLPGTDHAGIATQMVVERLLEKEGVKRHDLGRDAFVEKVWQWKRRSGGKIVYQQRRLGNSTDWQRERFTMDEGLSNAVLKVFVDLYKQGLIYRDKRLVNWDPKFETAISDLEVVQKEETGSMWYLKYPVVDCAEQHIVVGTTRPETMLGDTAVAVHPDDKRYTHLVGKHCLQPLTGRKIPIVADSYADPDQGSGAVKITPAHDFNDFEVGKRCDLNSINIMTASAKMNENCPKKYVGLDRFACRAEVIEDMKQKGYFVKQEPCVHTVPYGDRSAVPIEPYLTDQWYVNAKKLAQPAIESVRAGRTKFVPENWTKIYFNWMENIQPWCISRQLWWGHRIPAWYGPDGTIFVEKTEQEALAAANKHFGKAVALRRDEDVLDTWFSSALWPFSTLGWPEPQLKDHTLHSVAAPSDLQRFYQTDVLVTAFDIIFFWVARMMMFGLHFMKKEPFHTVVVHALVLDESGAKMSKSKGNVVDPLQLIDEYGCDALRFTLASLATPGKDIKFSLTKMQTHRNFITKIWNVAKFCQSHKVYGAEAFDTTQPVLPVNRWIVAKVTRATLDLEKMLKQYRFSDCVALLYHFIRGTFCDWYIEISKSVFWQQQQDILEETRQTTGWVLQQILKLMHPFMPFISERLWEEFGDKKGLLVSSSWPALDMDTVDRQAEQDIDWVVTLVKSVRSLRASLAIPLSTTVPLHIKDMSKKNYGRLVKNSAIIKRLGKISSIDMVTVSTENAAQFLLGEATLFIPVQNTIDVEAETARLRKILTKAEGEAQKFEHKLANKGYLTQAPQHIIEKDRQSLSSAQHVIAKTKKALQKMV